MLVICHDGAPRRALILWPRVSQAHCLAVARTLLQTRNLRRSYASFVVSPENDERGKYDPRIPCIIRGSVCWIRDTIYPCLCAYGRISSVLRAHASRGEMFLFSACFVSRGRVSGVLLSKETAGPNTTVETALRDSR